MTSLSARERSTLTKWLTSAAIFVAAIYTAHHIVLFAYRYLTERFHLDIDCPPHWPFSIYNPRGPHGLAEYAAIALTLAVGFWALRRLPKRGFPPAEVAMFGLALVLLTSAVQGVPRGFANPVSGGINGQQYYHDALDITAGEDNTSLNAATVFLHNFNRIQPTLRTHARTHPPGAVLFFWILHRALSLPPAAIGILIAVFSVLISAWSLRSFAVSLLGLEDALAGYASFLYLLLPVVQIYYCAALDAVITSLLLAAAALWLRPARIGSTLGAAALVTTASFLTFGFAWAQPVLLIMDMARGERRWWRIAAIPLMMALLYGALKAGLGFDYQLALRTASHLENPMGFRGTVEPVSYTFTRLEDITEMAAFLGPFLLVLLRPGLCLLKRDHRATWIIFLSAVGAMALLFVAGAYHTGETARACIFLYPYLLLPALPALRDSTERQRLMLATLVLLQSLAMQMWGNWFW